MLRMYCVLCACSTSCTQQTQNSAPPPTYAYGASAAITAWRRTHESCNLPRSRSMAKTTLFSYSGGDSILFFFSHSAGARARVEPRRSSQTLNVGRRRTYHPSHTNNRKRRGFYTGSSYLQCTTATCGYMNTSITWCTSARHMGHRVISGRRAHSAHMQRCPHGTNAASFSRSVHTTHKRWSFLDISSRCAFLAFARRASI